MDTSPFPVPTGTVSGDLSAHEFLACGWFDHGGLVAGWTKATKKNRFFQTADELVATQLGKPDEYIGVPIYEASAATAQSRAAEFVRGYRACFLDIDAGEEKYRRHGDAVYPTTDTAYEALYHAYDKGHVPLPSALVASGNGFHVWYFLTRLVGPDEWKDRQSTLARAYQHAGLRIDKNAQQTTQLARLPGTIHGDTGRVVRVLWYLPPERT